VKQDLPGDMFENNSNSGKKMEGMRYFDYRVKKDLITSTSSSNIPGYLAVHVIKAVTDPMNIIDTEFRIVWANEARAIMHQRSLDEMQGRYCYKMFQRRDDVCDGCPVVETLKTGKPCIKERYTVRPDGKIVWYETHSWPIFDEDGKVKYIVEYARDVTQRKLVENELIETKNSLSRILNEIGDGLVVIDRNFNIIMANPAMTDILGSSDCIIGEKCFRIFNNKFCHTDSCGLNRILRGESVVKYERYHNNRWIQYVITPYRDSKGNISGIIKSMRDITYQRLAEERIRKMNNILKAIKAIDQLITRESDLCRMLSSSCDILCSIRGYLAVIIASYDGKVRKIAESGKKGFLEIKNKTPGCIKKAIEMNKAIVLNSSGYKCRNCDYRKDREDYSAIIIPFKTSNKQMVLVVYATIGHFDGEEVELLVDIANDIGFAMDKFQIEENLHQSEEKYRITFEHTGTAMAIVEKDMTISLVNSEFEKLSGYVKREIEGKKSWIQFIHPADAEKVLGFLKYERGGKKALRKFETRFIGRDGEVKSIMATVCQVPGIEKTVVSITDISSLKKLNKLLKALSEINELVAKEENPEIVLKAVCERLTLLYDAVFTSLIRGNELIPVKSEGIDLVSVRKAILSCPSISKAIEGEIAKIKMDDKQCRHCTDRPHRYVLSIPLIHNIQHGVITIHSTSDFTEDEVALLKKLSKNIAFALYSHKVEEEKKKAMEQLTSNLYQFEHSADKLRNPLTVIMTTLELKDELEHEKFVKIIKEQTARIKKELDDLRREEIKTFLLTENRFE